MLNLIVDDERIHFWLFLYNTHIHIQAKHLYMNKHLIRPIMADSVFRKALEFLYTLGMYDVILPFLLVFAVVFAILEKTKVFGVDKIEGVEYTKKNINAIIAFVIGLLVVLSTTLVKAINESMSNIVLLMLMSISFLILIGTFYHYEEKVLLEGAWRKMFMILFFIITIMIFLHAIKTESGESWLDAFWNFLVNNWTADYAAAVIFLVIVIAMILFITQERKPKKAEKKED